MMLEATSKWADKMIFLSDNADEDTEKLILSYENTMLEKTGHSKSIFNTNESELRSKLWDVVRKTAKEDDWIVSMDCDEVFYADEIKKSFKKAELENAEKITFRLIDLWEKHEGILKYRVDGYWSPRITRAYKFKNEPFGVTGKIHCGCLPKYTCDLKDCLDLETRLIHYGWLNDDDKKSKSEFYLNKTGFGDINNEHAITVMYRNPTLFELKKTNFVDRHKILMATLIKNREWCLKEYLDAMEKQSKKYSSDNISWYFIVNDSTDNSQKIVEDFKKKFDKKYNGRIEIEVVNFNNCDVKDHSWSRQKLLNMSYMRNKVAGKMIEMGLDAIFMVDTDIILQSNDTLRHMVSLERDVLSEVFWASWGNNDSRKWPNVWINGGWNVTPGFINMLKQKGVYEVGGLGACTVYFKDAFMRGCNFDRVNFLPQEINGEDRDFCCRASVRGVKLYADTYKTPIHLEKEDFVK